MLDRYTYSGDNTNLGTVHVIVGNSKLKANVWFRHNAFQLRNEHGYSIWNEGGIIENVFINDERAPGRVGIDVYGNVVKNTLPEDVQDNPAVLHLINQARLRVIRQVRHWSAHGRISYGCDPQEQYDAFDAREGEWSDVAVVDGEITVDCVFTPRKIA